uniref:Peptidase A2 domain-containing protein n=1 Tax=Candidatus Methanogaster sp. ANME-2c ERB4 TaxID=2759911 RepID=A0A7G9YH23_9EURY|nr:hypothetical protein POPKKDDM_00026 [Methanosarcinales archaeon ANME-2c ERB4]
MIVDSGADITVLSKRMSDIRGIDVENGEEKIFRGIVGEIIAYVHRIPLFIDGREVEVRVAFALAEVPNLLGRLDIFRNFEIRFRKEEDFCFSD